MIEDMRLSVIKQFLPDQKLLSEEPYQSDPISLIFTYNQWMILMGLTPSDADLLTSRFGCVLTSTFSVIA